MDFSVEAEWHFNATVHTKDENDGVKTIFNQQDYTPIFSANCGN